MVSQSTPLRVSSCVHLFSPVPSFLLTYIFNFSAWTEGSKGCALQFYSCKGRQHREVEREEEASEGV